MEFDSDGNLSNVAVQYVRRLRIPITATTLVNHLEQNAHYPTMYSLCDVFEHFGIPGDVLSGSEEELIALEPPYIAYLGNENLGNYFILVTEVEKNEITYLANTSRAKRMPKEKFFQEWQNVIYKVDGDLPRGEKNYQQKRRAEKKVRYKGQAIVAGAIFVFVFFIYLFFIQLGYNNSSGKILISAGLILLTKLLGTVISILFIILEIGKSNSFVKDICTIGKQTNCNAVLGSKGAKIWGISWSDVGLFYFVSSLLFLFAPSVTFVEKIPYLAIAGSLAIPYTFYSIYYQWQVAKQWCPLCLVVQAVLIIEFIWSINYFWAADRSFAIANVDIHISAAVIISVLLPILIWYTIKPILLNARNTKAYTTAYKKLLFNQQIFASLLQQEPDAPQGWEKIGISIGNPHATTTIIYVTNPYCHACVAAHSYLKEILNENDQINIKIIFFVYDRDIEKVRVIQYFIAIAAEVDMLQMEKILDDWYLSEKKDYVAFVAKYPLQKKSEYQSEMISQMNRWCAEAEIVGTPAFFINGKKLPEIYNIEALKDFILYHTHII